MNSNKNWELRVRSKVWKELAKFPKGDNERLLKIMGELPLNPYAGDIEKMKGEEQTWRRRIGAYRIFYELRPHERVIYVFHIERRTSNTY